MIEGTASSLGRRDEVPNIELAEKICRNNDRKKLAEIAVGLKGSDKNCANDCIKVMYETGYRKPELIYDYAPLFLDLLKSRNNRLVWGTMNALSLVTAKKADLVFNSLDTVISAYEKGSVITVDCSISVFASLAAAAPEYEKKVFPVLMRHLETCRPKAVAQHAGRTAVCITKTNSAAFLSVLQKRMADLSENQKKRINKLIDKLNKECV